MQSTSTRENGPKSTGKNSQQAYQFSLYGGGPFTCTGCRCATCWGNLSSCPWLRWLQSGCASCVRWQSLGASSDFLLWTLAGALTNYQPKISWASYHLSTICVRLPPPASQKPISNQRKTTYDAWRCCCFFQRAAFVHSAALRLMSYQQSREKNEAT